jgi:hypothetical protein
MWAAGYDWREGLAAVNEIRQEPVDGDGDGVLNEEEKEIEKARQKFLGAYEKFVAKQQKADGEIGRLREAKAAHVAEVNAAIAEKDDKKQKKAQRLVDSLDNKIDRESFRREDTDAIGGAFEKYSGALGKQANEAEEVRDDIKLRLDASPDDPELQKGFAEAEAKFQEKSARSEAMRPLEDKVMGTPKKAAESADVHEIAKAIQVGPKGGRYYLAPSGGKVYLTRSRRLWADVDGDGIDDGYYLDENGKKVRPQDHPDLVAARKQIEKARRAYEKKLARYEEKKAPLTKDLDAAETAFTAAEDKQAAALNARDDADSAVDEAESAVEEHHAMIAELRREDPERLEQPLWLDDHEQPINGHQALAQAERDAPTVEADVPAAKAAAKQADREATAAEKEYAKAERHRDNLAWKEENLSLPDTDDVERAQEEYADTSREIAAEHREAGDEVAAKAFDDHAAATEAEITDPSTLAAPGVESAPNPAAAEPDAPAKPDDPYAIQIGPSGGRYYLAPSGQKVYLQ